MEPERFDHLVRALSTAASRRVAASATLAGLLLGLLRPTSPEAARRGTGKHRRRSKRRDGPHHERDRNSRVHGDAKKRGKHKGNKKSAKKRRRPPPPPGGSPPPIGRVPASCATNRNPAFESPITALPENEVTSCIGLIQRRLNGIYKEFVNDQGHWEKIKAQAFGEGAVVVPNFEFRVAPHMIVPSDNGEATAHLPAGFNALQPTWATICQPTAAATDPVPATMVCAQGAVSFTTSLEQRAYRANWNVETTGASSACKSTVRDFRRVLDRHEGGHWQDHLAIAAWYQAQWSQRTCYGCVPLQAGQTSEQALGDALRVLDLNVGRVVAEVNAAIYQDANDCAAEYHRAHGANTLNIVCDACTCEAPSTACGEACCAKCEDCLDAGTGTCREKPCGGGGHHPHPQTCACECRPTPQEYRTCAELLDVCNAPVWDASLVCYEGCGSTRQACDGTCRAARALCVDACNEHPTDGCYDACGMAFASCDDACWEQWSLCADGCSTAYFAGAAACEAAQPGKGCCACEYSEDERDGCFPFDRACATQTGGDLTDLTYLTCLHESGRCRCGPTFLEG